MTQIELFFCGRRLYLWIALEERQKPNRTGRLYFGPHTFFKSSTQHVNMSIVTEHVLICTTAARIMNAVATRKRSQHAGRRRWPRELRTEIRHSI